MPPLADKPTIAPRAPDGVKEKLNLVLGKLPEEKLVLLFEVFCSENITSFKLDPNDLSERRDRNNFMPGKKEDFVKTFSDKIIASSDAESNTVNAIINALRFLNNPYADKDQASTNQTIQNITSLLKKLSEPAK